MNAVPRFALGWMVTLVTAGSPPPPVPAAALQNAAVASRADFSGRWAAVEPGAPTGPSGGRGDMGSGWGTPLTITQDANRIVVEYAFFSRGDMQPPVRFTFALDGTETRNTVMMGRGSQVQVSRATWDGAKLLISTRHSFTDPSTGKVETIEVRQILSLDSPTSLTIETIRSGALGGPETTTKTTYRKL